MKIDFVPLLGIQRELQGMPRNLERFQKYLETIGTRGGDGTLVLPSLIAANPMGKEHVTTHLDALLAIDADTLGAQAAEEVALELADEPGEFKLALVLADDLMGGWTNRYANEYSSRFPDSPATAVPGVLPRWLKDYWLTALLWTSDAPSAKSVRDTIRSVVYRHVYFSKHGFARTLQEMLAQEGWVMAHAGCERPVLEEEDIEYTRQVLAPFLASTDLRTHIECLFGDEAGKTLGFSPRGLSPWAGLAIALIDGKKRLASDTIS
jgi:hypothetical protein